MKSLEPWLATSLQEGNVQGASSECDLHLRILSTHAILNDIQTVYNQGIGFS